MPAWSQNDLDDELIEVQIERVTDGPRKARHRRLDLVPSVAADGDRAPGDARVQ